MTDGTLKWPVHQTKSFWRNRTKGAEEENDALRASLATATARIAELEQYSAQARAEYAIRVAEAVRVEFVARVTGGVIASDLVVVAGAINGLLACGLTRDALLLLVQAKCPKPHGRPMPIATIDDVLSALENLHTFLEAPAEKPKAGR